MDSYIVSILSFVVALSAMLGAAALWIAVRCHEYEFDGFCLPDNIKESADDELRRSTMLEW